jgi:hypothetical protein
VDVHSIVSKDKIPLGAVWMRYEDPPTAEVQQGRTELHHNGRQGRGSHELAEAVLPLLATIGSRAVRLVSATWPGREAFAQRIVPSWASADVDGRIRLYGEVNDALGVSMRGPFTDWLARRAHALKQEATFHTDVTIKPAKQEVGPGKTAYGGKVVVDGDTPRVEVGAGLIPNPPKTQDVIDHPAGEILNKDRIEGGGAWIKFNY